MSDLHKIDEDLRDINGRPAWLWRALGYGTLRLVELLKAHAELQRRYPDEERYEADD